MSANSRKHTDLFGINTRFSTNRGFTLMFIYDIINSGEVKIMDAKTIGNSIAKLRKAAGMTQSELAAKLDVSSKAVSKWENGQGYPDITTLPALATVFGVTIDYIMLGEKRGITIAGNILVDTVKNIDIYPKQGMLVKINDISRAVGGCAPNVAIDLAKIDRSVPISVIGKAGTDENGRYLISEMQKNGIDVDGVTLSESTPTSFTDVMSMPGGERTFFHKKGANAEFGIDDIDVKSLNCNIFHIGYIHLLDEFDKEDKEYGTVMARLLCKIQKEGIKTSIDVVSDSGADYAAKVIPALKYSDYAIMNEVESCAVFGLEPYDENEVILKENIRTAMVKMAECGVKEKVIIHSKKVSFAYDVKTETFTEVNSLKIPKEEIKGSVGAGDAFCAGCLYGLYNNYNDKQLLEFSSAAAACNLFAANSVDGMKSKNEIVLMNEEYERM